MDNNVNTRLEEGFKGQGSVVLPREVLERLQSNPLTCSLYVTDIGFYPRAHRHYRQRSTGGAQHILIYCTEGRGWLEHGGDKYDIHKNQYVIIPKGMAHSYGAALHEPWSIYWLHFAGDKADEFVDDDLSPRGIDLSVNARYKDRIMLFEEIYQNLSRGFIDENLEYASVCLWHMLGSFRYLAQFRAVNELRYIDMVDRCVQHMQEHIDVRLTVEEMAVVAGVSPSHFSQLFRRKTGKSPLDFFIGLKVQRASELLEYTDMKVKEIATLLGIEDQYYFSRLFTKAMGVSPRVYRKRERG